MQILYSCPKCGKPESSFGDSFCGECEAKYQAEQQQQADDEIAHLRSKMNSCQCPEGDCSECVSNYAQVLALQGREAEAIAVINQ